MADKKPDKNYPPVTPPTYKAALPANTEFEFVSAHTIFPYEKKDGMIQRIISLHKLYMLMVRRQSSWTSF